MAIPTIGLIGVPAGQETVLPVGWDDVASRYRPLRIDSLGRLVSDNPRDAFGRLRVSNPEYVFDAQLTYDLAPLLFEAITAQSGATVAHDSTNRCATLTFSSTPTGGFVPFCEIKNANVQANPYIQTANLPVRVGMTCTGTVSTTMQAICSSVITEGGAMRMRYPITLDAAGAVRDLGTLSMLVTGVGGTSATRCVFNWREVR